MSASFKSYSNILPSCLFLLPERFSLFLVQITLVHGNINQRSLNTLTHASTASANKHPSIQRVDDELKPDQPDS